MLLKMSHTQLRCGDSIRVAYSDNNRTNRKRNELCEIEVGRYAGLSFCWNLMEKQQNRARKSKGKTTKNHISNY
mgnify:CR=1 FL=1